MTRANSDFDFGIIGSGFAASVLAMILQRLGRRCVMIDSASHPRFAIGESSTPIADQILLDLSQDFDLPELRELARWQTARRIPSVVVGCKQGFSYFFHDQRCQPSAGAVSKTQGQEFAAKDRIGSEFQQAQDVSSSAVPYLVVPASPDQENADSHWLRSTVDQFLAKSAQQCGAVLWERTTVVSVDRVGTGWRLGVDRYSAGQQVPNQQVPNLEETELQVDFLVDASGAANVVGRALGIPSATTSMLTQTACVYGHFHLPVHWESVWQKWAIDSSRFSFPAQNAAMHHVTNDGWLWHLGFDNDQVSLGWVLNQNSGCVLPKSDDRQHLAPWWDKRLAAYPLLQGLYQNAEPVDVHRTLRYIPKVQRMVSQAAGEGWLALPSTAGFVDPLHSSGISHSLSAVQKIAMHLARCDHLSTEFCRDYDRRLRQEFWLLDRIVSLAYASLPDAKKWEAATMVYFTAAIAFEEERNRRRAIPDRQAIPIPDFLLADQPDWLEQVIRAMGLVNRKKPPKEGWLVAMSDILGSRNTAGLCDFNCKGVYQYTSAKK